MGGTAHNSGLHVAVLGLIRRQRDRGWGKVDEGETGRPGQTSLELTSWNNYNRLGGIESILNCLAPHPGVTRVRNNGLKYKNLTNSEGVGFEFVGLHINDVLPRQVLSHL